MHDSLKDMKSCQDVPFGVIRLEFIIKPIFIPEIVRNLAENWT